MSLFFGINRECHYPISSRLMIPKAWVQIESNSRVRWVVLSHLLPNGFPVSVDGVYQTASTWPSTESNQKETSLDGSGTCLGSTLGTADSFLPSTTHHLQSLVTIISPLNPSIICQARPMWLNHFYSRSHADWVERAPGFWAPVLYSLQISILPGWATKQGGADSSHSAYFNEKFTAGEIFLGVLHSACFM